MRRPQFTWKTMLGLLLIGIILSAELAARRAICVVGCIVAAASCVVVYFAKPPR